MSMTLDFLQVVNKRESSFDQNRQHGFLKSMGIPCGKVIDTKPI